MAVFGASNFPLALSVAGSDVVSALAAGCPVVVKGHPSHPGTSEILGRAIVRAIDEGVFPKGCFSLLQGVTPTLGQALVQHSAVRAVGFTGSLKGGRALFDLAASRSDPIPVFAEMGSVNPQFVFPDILANDPEGFADRLLASVTMGNGQFCTSPGLVFVPEHDRLPEMIDHLCDEMQSLAGQAMLNPGIATAFCEGIARWETLIDMTMLARGHVSMERTTPTLARLDFQGFLAHREILLEEVFGPAVMLVVCEEISQFVNAARLFPGQLGASIHGDSSSQTSELMTTLQRFAGRIVLNGFPTGIETTHAMHHGGPYPATTCSQHTSLGQSAIARWVRPVCFQNVPNELLPSALQDDNPLGIARLVDGVRMP